MCFGNILRINPIIPWDAKIKNDGHPFGMIRLLCKQYMDQVFYRYGNGSGEKIQEERNQQNENKNRKYYCMPE